MPKLSISRAWEETRSILSRDGRLYGSVALALIGFPSLIMGLVAPDGAAAAEPKLDWTDLIGLFFVLCTVAGQVAIVRLAIGPSTTVGDAIAHGFRRMPALIGAIILVALALFIPVAIVAVLAGVPLDRPMTEPTSGMALLVLILLVLLIFAWVRLVVSAPVASAEGVGPVGIIRRSWALTSGYFWPLFGFLVTFFIAAAIVLLAVGAAVGAVVALLLGPLEPFSTSALVVGLVQALFNALVTLFLEVMVARIYLQLAGRLTAGTAAA